MGGKKKGGQSYLGHLTQKGVCEPLPGIFFHPALGATALRISAKSRRSTRVESFWSVRSPVASHSPLHCDLTSSYRPLLRPQEALPDEPIPVQLLWAVFAKSSRKQLQMTKNDWRTTKTRLEFSVTLVEGVGRGLGWEGEEGCVAGCCSHNPFCGPYRWCSVMAKPRASVWSPCVMHQPCKADTFLGATAR